MTGGALPGWGPLFIHATAGTSWVPALGPACVGDHRWQEAAQVSRGPSRMAWGGVVGAHAACSEKREQRALRDRGGGGNE